MDTSDCEVIRGDSSIKDKMFKVVLIGSASVGKSCILLRAGKDEFKEAYNVTVGTDMCSLVVKVKSKTVELQVWDTAGMEQFRSMIKVFFNGAHAVLLVYDITRKESFDALEMWLHMVRESAPPDVKIVLVGNKKDETEARQVSTDMGKEYEKQNSLFDFVETSAKTGEGVIDMFKKLAKELFTEHEDFVPQTAGKKLSNSKKESKGCC